MVAWRMYLALFLAVIVAHYVSGYVPVPGIGLPFGLERAAVSAIIVIILFLIFERAGL
jgi:hypothetical protein